MFLNNLTNIKIKLVGKSPFRIGNAVCIDTIFDVEHEHPIRFVIYSDSYFHIPSFFFLPRQKCYKTIKNDTFHVVFIFFIRIKNPSRHFPRQKMFQVSSHHKSKGKVRNKTLINCYDQPFSRRQSQKKL